MKTTSVRAWVLAVSVVAGAAVSAEGQILPPAPAEATPREAFEPPPAPPERPGPTAQQRTAATAPAAPELVEYGEDGKLVRIGLPAEEAALLAMEFDEPTMMSIIEALEERRGRIERKVFANLEDMASVTRFIDVESHRSGLTVAELQDGSQVARVFMNDSMLDDLQRRGVISPLVRTRAKSAAENYSRAVLGEAAKAFNNDASNLEAMSGAAFRATMSQQLAEVRAALDGMLHDAQQDGVFGDVSGRDVSGMDADGLRKVFVADLSPEQRHKIIAGVRPGIEQPAEDDAGDASHGGGH